MFGFILASRNQLTQESWERYNGLYCGLCRELGQRSGAVSRLTLTYDMTFLIMVLSGLFDQEEENGLMWCALHPLKRRRYIRTQYTAYAADMNVLLAYYNLLDNWQDDHSLASLAGSGALKARVREISRRYPRQDQAVREALEELSQLEKTGELNPDKPAACFGRLMAEIFVHEESEKAPALRSFGYTLGRLIYIMDACIDFDKDVKREKYNPMTAYQKADFEPMLQMLAAECADSYLCLGCEKDKDIIENILYCGLWSSYSRKYSKINRKEGAVD